MTVQNKFSSFLTCKKIIQEEREEPLSLAAVVTQHPFPPHYLPRSGSDRVSVSDRWDCTCCVELEGRDNQMTYTTSTARNLYPFHFQSLEAL